MNNSYNYSSTLPLTECEFCAREPERPRMVGGTSPLRSNPLRHGKMSEIAFHEKAGRSQVDSSLTWLNKVCFSRRVATVAMLPSALSRSDSFRSVHVGRSRFSRCCHLFGALWFCSLRVEPGPGH